MTTLMVMASSISGSTPTSFCSSSSIIPKPTISCSLSSSLVSYPKVPNFRPSKWIPTLGLSPFSPWNGLSHLGISVTPPNTSKLVRKRRSKRKGAAYASLFGVGAPEALVIGVVALLVFGPKGLAEVARNLGKTLRAFQPTIRELQDVSREFKSTLEKEIGLDDFSSPSQNMYSSNKTNITPTPSFPNTEDSQTIVDPNGAPPPKPAYTSEEYLKITEEQLKAVAAKQLGETPETTSSGQPQTQSQEGVQEVSEATPPPQKPESNA